MAEIENRTFIYSAISPNSVIVLEYKHFVIYFASMIYTPNSGQGKRPPSPGVTNVLLGDCPAVQCS